ncbi:hypothetical protein [Micromonospora sp. WMMD712]|uniref:hypothetical protein n=1 Tax=Micromonospora sp. WMMD712 TaxID=3016096 RepID=UPI00249A8299|nr:hypothetical protein [Micromonospora sp. WMMD712]WFE58618.1 hypothetical protein O7633_17970 [Micromonospora sp. WMMD712]
MPLHGITVEEARIGREERSCRESCGSAALRVGAWVEAMPDVLIQVMIRFEERFGGLWYPVIGSKRYGARLDGAAVVHRGPLDLAFTGIVDGDRTWGVDLPAGGCTAMEPGHWSYRLIDHCVLQRLESHATLMTVSGSEPAASRV